MARLGRGQPRNVIVERNPLALPGQGTAAGATTRVGTAVGSAPSSGPLAASDDFNRSNGVLTTPWVPNGALSVNPTINSNHLVAQSGSAVYNYSVWDSPCDTQTQFSEATLTISTSSTTTETSVCVRCTPDAGDSPQGYFFSFRYSLTDGEYYFSVYKMTGDSSTSAVYEEGAASGTYTLRLEVETRFHPIYEVDLGFVTAYVDDVPIFSDFDEGAELSGDYVGLGIYQDAGTVLTTTQIDNWSGGDTVEAPPSGSGSGTTVRSGSATGKRVCKGSGSGSTVRTGTATGKKVCKGSSSGSTTRLGMASGSAPSSLRSGSGTGSTVRTGTATGRNTHRGTASGSTVRVGTASGQFPTPMGTGSGTTVRTSSAVGKRVPKASATGSCTRVGTATGKRVRKGTASGATVRVGTATGVDSIDPNTGSGTGMTVRFSFAAGDNNEGPVGGARRKHDFYYVFD